MREKIDKSAHNQRVYDNNILDGHDQLWHAPFARVPALAAHQPLVSDLTSLIHALYTHPLVASTLASIRESFDWPLMARDVLEYVLSCGCRRQRRFATRRVATLPGRAIRPSDVLEMDLTSLGVKSLAGNEYLLLAMDIAFKFPLFTLPLPSK